MAEAKTKTSRRKVADTRPRRIGIGAAALKAALKDVLGAIETRNTLPILDHVRIEAGDGRMALVGTDLDLWVTRTLACEPGPDASGFVACVPAKPLATVLDRVEGGCELVLELIETKFEIRAGRARFTLHTLPAEDFPLPAPFTGERAFELTCTAATDALAAVDHAISTEETRYYLNGVLLQFEQGGPASSSAAVGEQGALLCVATDGHRLARRSIVPPAGAAGWPDVILPRKAVALLQKLLAAGAKTGDKEDPARVLVESTASGNLLRFDLPAADDGDVTLQAKAIDGTFPDWRRVVPADPPRSAQLDKALLASAVRRVSALASDKTRAVKCSFSSGKLELVSRCPDLGEAREELPAIYDGEEFELGFDATYLLDALAALPADQVTLRFGDDPVGPVRIGTDNDDHRLVQVLMPVRV